MSKHNPFSFLAGALVGVGVGVAATIFLSSEQGKKLRKNVSTMMSDFYAYASQRAEEIKKMGSEEYKAYMKTLAENYIKFKNLSGKSAEIVMREAQKSWAELTELWQSAK